MTSIFFLLRKSILNFKPAIVASAREIKTIPELLTSGNQNARTIIARLKAAAVQKFIALSTRQKQDFAQIAAARRVADPEVKDVTVNIMVGIGIFPRTNDPGFWPKRDAH